MENTMIKVLVVGLFCSLTACMGVNEMPNYRSRISAVSIDSAVTESPEVSFSQLVVSDPNDPDQIALSVMESRIKERLADRLFELAPPALVADAMLTSVQDQLRRRFPWEVAGPNQAADAQFNVFVRHYGIDVDEAGLGMFYIDSLVEGRYLETGTLIYEETVRTEFPLTAMRHGHDAVSDAAARSLNLLDLDELPAAEFQTGILSGTDQAAFELVDELFDATYDR